MYNYLSVNMAQGGFRVAWAGGGAHRCQGVQAGPCFGAEDPFRGQLAQVYALFPLDPGYQVQILLDVLALPAGCVAAVIALGDILRGAEGDPQFAQQDRLDWPRVRIFMGGSGTA